MPIQPIRERPEFGASFKAEGQRSIDPKKLEKACVEFESLFIHQIMKTMRQTVPQTGFLSEGRERTIFQSLFDEEVSKNIARNGGLGLGKILYWKMQKMGKEENLSPSPVKSPIEPELSKGETVGLSNGANRTGAERTP